MNILIVDDSPAIQTIVRRALEKEGFADHEFRTANSGMAALDIIESWVPDLVLTDWHMPGMGGLELLQVLRQTHGTSMVIGFVTTESVKDRLDEAVRNGAAFVLPKPFTDAQLGDAVRAALSNHAAAKAATAEAAHDGARPFGVGRITAIETALKKRIDPRLTLKEIDAVDFTRLSLPSFLAFFGLGDATAIRAFCLLDRPAFAMLEAFLAGSTVAKDGAGRVAAVLAELSGALFDAPPDQPVTLLRSQLLPQLTSKLLELLDKKLGRACLEVNVPGYSPGVVTLIAR